jgi:hypothetical protein
MMPKKANIEVVVVDLREESLYSELAKTAKEIVSLTTVFHATNSSSDPMTHDRIAFRLLAAEKDFFLLYNQCRIKAGFEALEGERFTGEFNYASIL